MLARAPRRIAKRLGGHASPPRVWHGPRRAGKKAAARDRPAIGHSVRRMPSANPAALPSRPPRGARRASPRPTHRARGRRPRCARRERRSRRAASCVAPAEREIAHPDRPRRTASRDARSSSRACRSARAGRSSTCACPPRPEGEGAAWEALLAGGQQEPIFAGMTGPSSGDPGERTGQGGAGRGRRPRRASCSSANRARTCASAGRRSTLLDPLRALPGVAGRCGRRRCSASTPSSSPARSASWRRRRAWRSKPPLAQLLVARGSSVPGSRGRRAHRRRSGDRLARAAAGHGAGRVRRHGGAPGGAHHAHADRRCADRGAARRPRTARRPGRSTCVACTETFEITMPGDAWLKPGATYEIVLPRPVRHLVRRAGPRRRLHARPGAPRRGRRRARRPTASSTRRARRSTTWQAQTRARPRHRGRAGARARRATRAPGRGRRPTTGSTRAGARWPSTWRRATRTARRRRRCSRGGCASPTARRLARPARSSSAARAGRPCSRAAARRCGVARLRGAGPGGHRARGALEPIADALAATPEDDPATRAALRGRSRARSPRPRGPTGAAAGRPEAQRRDPPRDDARRRGARGRGPAESEAAVAELLTGSPPLRARYLVLGPLGELARAGDAPRPGASSTRSPTIRSGRCARAPPSWPRASRTRRRAARRCGPRSRAAGARGGARVARSRGPARGREGRRRGARARRLVVREGAGRGDARERRPPPRDGRRRARRRPARRPSPVRGAAVVALARRRALPWRASVRERLDDRAKTRRCAPPRRGRSAPFAMAIPPIASRSWRGALAGPLTDEDGQQIGLGALVGLAALQPARSARSAGAAPGTGAPPVRACGGAAGARRAPHVQVAASRSRPMETTARYEIRAPPRQTGGVLK